MKKYYSGKEIDEQDIEQAKIILGSDCDSVAEANFIHVAQKWSNCKIVPQADGDGYRADFVFDDRIVVEIDGKEYHNTDKDYIRDQKVIKDYPNIVRFTASDAIHNPSFCVMYLAFRFPSLFDENVINQCKRRMKYVEAIYNDDLKTEFTNTDKYFEYHFELQFMPVENNDKYIDDNQGTALDYCRTKHTVVRELYCE